MSKNSKTIVVFYLVLVLLLVFSFISGVHAQTATISATPSASPATTLPDTGVSLPTLFGIVVGALAIIFSLAIAL